MANTSKRQREVANTVTGQRKVANSSRRQRKVANTVTGQREVANTGTGQRKVANTGTGRTSAEGLQERPLKSQSGQVRSPCGTALPVSFDPKRDRSKQGSTSAATSRRLTTGARGPVGPFHAPCRCLLASPGHKNQFPSQRFGFESVPGVTSGHSGSTPSGVVT